MWISTSLMHDIECERRRELGRMAQSSTWLGLRRRRRGSSDPVAPVPAPETSPIQPAVAPSPMPQPGPSPAPPPPPAAAVAERERVVRLAVPPRRRPGLAPTSVEAPRGTAA